MDFAKTVSFKSYGMIYAYLEPFAFILYLCDNIDYWPSAKTVVLQRYGVTCRPRDLFVTASCCTD